MFLFCVFLLLAISLICLKRWLARSNLAIDRSLETHVTNVMADVDNVVFDDDEADEGLTPAQRKTRFRAKMVQIAKAEFGPLKRLEANRLMVRKFLRDTMRDHGLRPQHISMHLDVVVRMVFIPSLAEIEAHKIGATYEAQVREVEVTSDWISNIANFGKMLGFKAE